jgi:chromosome segregation ATPase
MNEAQQLQGARPVQEAAQQLENDLSRFEDTIAAAEQLQINAEKRLLRAGRLLEACASHEAEIANHLQALANAMVAAQSRIQSCMERTAQLARRVEARAATRAQLVERIAELGRKAAALGSAAVQRQNGATPTATDLAEVLGAVAAGAEELLREAEQLARDASSSEWADVARDADSLHQQLKAARAKIVALR